MAASFLLLLAPLLAQEPVRDHTVTPEDYFEVATITDFAPAPDLQALAWAEMRWDRDLDRRNTDLWVRELPDGPVRRLTFDPAADHGPVWSPDGHWIYFLSARKGAADAPWSGRPQVWRVAAAGGEPEPVTRRKDGVEDFLLVEEGRTLLLLLAEERQEEDRWKALRERYPDLQYGHGRVRAGVVRALDLETWRESPVWDGGEAVHAWAASLDGRRLALVTAPTHELISYEGRSRVLIVDRAGGWTREVPGSRMWRELAPSPNGWIVEPCWAPDGAALAFRVDFDGYPGRIFVTRVGEDGPRETRELERPGEVHATGPMAWSPAGELCFTAEDRARAHVYAVAGAAEAGDGPRQARILGGGDEVVSGFAFSRSGALVALRGDPRNLPDLVLLEEDGWRRLTRVNPMVDRWRLPQMRIVRWTSADGTPVEGILELPPDWQPEDGPLPTLVVIHGGPTAASLYQLRYWIYGRTLYASRGWAVLCPNYRGSTGYGDRFLTELIGHKNDRDVEDILAGVDFLVEEGIADPERLACMGWSNGGYLVNCLITRTDRFRAASSGAGVFDTVMQWEIEDTPGHVQNFSGGLPWEVPRAMHRSSPLYRAGAIRTPTVIHVGEKDPRVPPEHARALHRVLHRYLDVPVHLQVYPGAGHGLSTWTHREAKMAWDLAWLEFFVLGRGAGAPAPAGLRGDGR